MEKLSVQRTRRLVAIDYGIQCPYADCGARFGHVRRGSERGMRRVQCGRCGRYFFVKRAD